MPQHGFIRAQVVNRRKFLDERITMESAVEKDRVAAAASLVMGQADEGRPIVLARGVPYARRDGNAHELIRPKEIDLFR